MLCRTINDALNSRFLELVPSGSVPRPCEAQSAARAEFRLPAAGAAGADTGARGKPRLGFGEPPTPPVETLVATARLDSAGLVALADALADVQAAVAAYGTPLTFQVTVEAPGMPPAAQQTLRGELAEAAAAFADTA